MAERAFERTRDRPKEENVGPGKRGRGQVPWWLTGERERPRGKKGGEVKGDVRDG
jgi:hypothetical protein